MKTLARVLSLLVVFCAFHYAQGMFEREIGLNDWKIENLGQLKDLKFLENTNLVYTLSTTGVLTLFDTEKKQIMWKKELPEDEDFQLRYLSRNLLVYSQRRALLINSASHIIYDVHLEGLLEKGQVPPRDQ